MCLKRSSLSAQTYVLSLTLTMAALFQKFEATIQADDRSVPLDKGNIKLTFKSVGGRCMNVNVYCKRRSLQLHDKAEAREKERLKSEERKV